MIKETWAAIIPNRGTERKLFLEWQTKRAHEMGYDRVYVINFEPTSDVIDIYERIARGVEAALADGVTHCSIIESDDYYSLTYLKTVKKNMRADTLLFGVNQTMYYHLFSTGWRRMSHPSRSSLFCTSFKTEAFALLPAERGAFIDLTWWQAAVKTELPYQLINDDVAVGIKHGNVFGRVGGAGHTMHYQHYDLGLKMLRGLLDKPAFEFFIGIKNYYQETWNKGQRAI
jgi:hypothetical protein